MTIPGRCSTCGVLLEDLQGQDREWPTETTCRRCGLPPDYVCALDYEDAVRLLVDGTRIQRVEVGWHKDDADQAVPVGQIKTAGSIGRRWLRRAAKHLLVKADADLRGYTVPRTERQFLATVKGIARELEGGGQALQWAAERLKKRSDVHGANQTYNAGRHLLHLADELVPRAERS